MIGRVQRVIHLHLDAPAKPAPRLPCNGCGVCCASEPCPIGALVSRRIDGACDALEWSDDEERYRCGLVAQPREHLPRTLAFAAPWIARQALRMISAGSGCDCTLEPVEPAD